jgi:hypothetical protein
MTAESEGADFESRREFLRKSALIGSAAVGTLTGLDRLFNLSLKACSPRRGPPAYLLEKQGGLVDVPLELPPAFIGSITPGSKYDHFRTILRHEKGAGCEISTQVFDCGEGCWNMLAGFLFNEGRGYQRRNPKPGQTSGIRQWRETVARRHEVNPENRSKPWSISVGYGFDLHWNDRGDPIPRSNFALYYPKVWDIVYLI